MSKNLLIDTGLIERGTLTYDIILICLASIEKQINKYAYLSKKFKRAGEYHNGSNKYELDKYIGYRTLLSKSIYPKYRIEDIKDLIKTEYAGAKCSVKMIDCIVGLVKGSSFQLLS